MNLIDGAIIIVLLMFIGTNLALGLVHALGAIVGFLLGMLVARYYYLPFAELLEPALLERQGIAKVLAFVIIFFIVQRAFALFVHLVQKVVRWLPFGGLVDRVGGIVVGFIEGLLVISILAFFLSQYLQPTSRLGQEFATSSFAQAHLVIAQITVPLLPKALQEAKGFVQ